MSKPPAFTPYQVLAIVLLALTQFSVILDFMVMSPLGDFLIKSMDLQPDQFGLAVSVYAFSAGISGLLTAGFADRYDRKKLLLFFYTGFIAGTVFCGLANTYPLLLAARLITGLFGGVIGSISMAIVTDLFSLEQRGRVMGIMQIGVSASQVLGIPIGLHLANLWGWQSAFIMIAILAIIICIIIILKLQPVTAHLKMQHDHSVLTHFYRTISKRNYRIGFAATAFLSIGGFMMMPFGSAFAVNNLHVTATQLPLLFMVAGVASLIVMPLVGRLSDRMDKFNLFVIASLAMMVLVGIYTNLTPKPLWIIMVFNVIMMATIFSRMIPAMALTTSIPEMQDRGAFMSINSSLQQIAGGIGAAVAGSIVVQKTTHSPLEHYNTLGYIVMIIGLAAVFLLYRVKMIIKIKKAAMAPVAVGSTAN
ncbi:MFS transporter [Pollutibacter soli]|uniref:MFS transporter n=1 Tax=Pollutibacter soli TaxID=3034157 RepID=UPI003014141D